MSKKLPTKNYNTTQLDPFEAGERHVIHRDMLAHAARWSHVLNAMKVGDTCTDFGCGSANLLETLYRNRYKAKHYIGLEIKKTTVEKAREKFHDVPWAEFHVVDLVKEDTKFFEELPRSKHVCSFEVLEHVGKINGEAFMRNFAACGDESSTFYLSTPNYDEKVGAAGNHTYDSGDGNGVQPQEFTHGEIAELIKPHFEVIAKYGTFASQKDYKKLMTPAQQEMFKDLSAYYDSNLVAVLFAPLFPEQSRNTLWKLKLK